MRQYVTCTLSLGIALAHSGPIAQASAPVSRHAANCEPKLLFSWWHKGQSGAQAVGFIAPSAVVVLLSGGPEMIGSIHGPPLRRFGGIAQSMVGAISSYVGGPRPKGFTLGALSASVAVAGPTHFKVPSGWDAGTDPVGTSLHGDTLAAEVRGAHGANAVCIWNVRRPNRPKIIQLATRRGRQAYPTALAFSPNGRHLVVGYSPKQGPGFICVWDIPSARLVLKLLAPPGKPAWQPRAITYLSRHRIAASSSGLYLADLARRRWLRAAAQAPRGVSLGAEKATWFGTPSPLLSLPASGRIACVLGGRAHPTIGICSAKTGRLLQRMTLRGEPPLTFITGLASAEKPGYIIVAVTGLNKGLTGYFAEIQMSTERVLWRSPDISGGCLSIAVSPDGRAAPTGGELGSRLWRLPLDR